MRKIRIIGIIGLAVGLLVAGLTVPILAQNPASNSDSVSSGVYLDQPTLQRLAEALGLTSDQLISYLREGQTLAEIAAEQNVAEEDVIEAIIAPYASELELRVDYNYLTQQQADTLLGRARDHALRLLTQNLSSSRNDEDYNWEEMEEYCSEMMGDGGMMHGGWGGTMHNGWDNNGGRSYSGGGMMGGGMMGGNNGGMMGGNGGGMMGGSGGMMGGSGGMMGGGMMGNW